MTWMNENLHSHYTFMVFAKAGDMNDMNTQKSILTVLPAIASMNIDNVTTNSVSLSWPIPLGNISSYIIQVLGTPSKELIVKTNVSHVDQLIPGHYYTFMVFATNGNINGTKTQNSTFTGKYINEPLRDLVTTTKNNMANLHFLCCF
ncbi:hypothetical protein XELAEV_18004623mg [Xenopus laevis]|uniref:Fibronectin type-III domain-containing protein n=1 Tax=Xenopus laevis TaxID=8355 RepID=A0A974GZJ8_XENLA|nr:hypothetical protein XELAEV_18004623mg [Xenopus laevis]